MPNTPGSYQDVIKQWHATHFCCFIPDVTLLEMILCPNNNYSENLNADGAAKN